MDLSPANLFAGIVVSCIGFGLFVYGKKQLRLPQLFVGIALCVFPYFIDGAPIVYGIAAGLLACMWLALRLGA